MILDITLPERSGHLWIFLVVVLVMIHLFLSLLKTGTCCVPLEEKTEDSHVAEEQAAVVEEEAVVSLECLVEVEEEAVVAICFVALVVAVEEAEEEGPTREHGNLAARPK